MSDSRWKVRLSLEDVETIREALETVLAGVSRCRIGEGWDCFGRRLAKTRCEAALANLNDQTS